MSLVRNVTVPQLVSSFAVFSLAMCQFIHFIGIFGDILSLWLEDSSLDCLSWLFC